MRQLIPALAVAVFLCAPVAQAQSAYVAGSLSADIARASHADDAVSPGTGEALSFSLRVGGAVSPRFGVELDFTRPSEIETDETPDVRILANTYSGALVSAGLGSVASALDVLPSSPILAWKVHTVQRTTTITAAAWARQEISPRFSMVYLGGIAFARTDRTVSNAFNYMPVYAALYPPTYQTKTVDYGQGPMAGLEARINLTDHAQLVPGFRFLSVADSWIMRPAVALSWTF